jgi:hypothetical protein
MIPLIVHHRVVDPFDTTLTACAEDWQQNMNARLVYDFLLLIVLFILPLTLMTYCYIRISFSLWFVDSRVRSSVSSSTTSNNPGRYSMMSEDFPQLDLNDVRPYVSSQKHRPYYVPYHKTYDNELKRKSQLQQTQQQQQQQQEHQQDGHNQQTDEFRALMNTANTKLISNQSRSITATTVITAPSTSRRSSSLIGRRLGETTYENPHLNRPSMQARQLSVTHRQSFIPYHSGFVRSSLSSLASHHRIQGCTSGIVNNKNKNNNNHHHHRSVADFERASRFLQSRRRVVKLLITLGRIIALVDTCQLFNILFFLF